MNDLNEQNNNVYNNIGEQGEPSLQSLDILTLMNMPLEKSWPELARRGMKTARSIKDTATKMCEDIVEEEYEKLCAPELTMDKCLEWLKTNRLKYPQSAYLFIYLEQNEKPRNQNDVFSVALAVLDAQKKPIYVNERKKGLFNPRTKNDDSIVCFVIPCGNIDRRLIAALNGNESVMIKL